MLLCRVLAPSLRLILSASIGGRNGVERAKIPTSAPADPPWIFGLRKAATRLTIWN
jgi:hypothetical protein